MKIPTFKGTHVNTDQLIAADIHIGATTAVNGLAAAASATTNPDLKRLFKEALQETFSEQEAIATYVMDKGWKKPHDSPDDQLKLAAQYVDSTIALKL